MSADDTDYYGELWSAIREQERLVQAKRLIESIKAIPRGDVMKPVRVMQAIDELIELNGMEVARRRMIYEQDVQKRLLSGPLPEHIANMPVGGYGQ